MSPPDKPAVPGTKHKDVAALIEQLGDAELSVRTRAVRAIFARGFAHAAAASKEWFGDREIADCFVWEDSKAGVKVVRTTVGIAVEPETFDRIRLVSGSPRLADVPPDLDAKEFELRAGEDARLDILTTRDVRGGGAIARYLEKHGAGIQQVELYVRDVHRAAELLCARFSLLPVYSEPREGADRTRVNFFLVRGKEGGKLLIELVEASGAEG